MTGRHAAPEAAILTNHDESAVIAGRAQAWITDYNHASTRCADDDQMWHVLLGRARALIEELARG